LGSSTELITLKPWCTGKQLPLGFSVLGQSIKQQAIIIIGPQAKGTSREPRTAQLVVVPIFPAPTPATVQGYRIL